jgi:hypothetical protein
LYKNGVFKRLFDIIFNFMAKKHARCAKCAYSTDSTSEMQVQPTPAMAPQMVPHRYRGRRTYGATRNRRCSSRFQLQNPPRCSKLLHSISAPDFKDFRQIMMATGPRAARGRTSAGESVGCIGLQAVVLFQASCGIFRRSRLKNVAHFAERVRCDNPQVTPPPSSTKQHTGLGRDNRRLPCRSSGLLPPSISKLDPSFS